MATARPGPGGRRHASGAPLPKQRVPTPLNTTSPRPRHARYAASLIAGHAPAAESDTTTARPCAPGRKQAAGDLVVGPGLQEELAQHFFLVDLLIANIDCETLYTVPNIERRCAHSQHYSLAPYVIEQGLAEPSLMCL